MFHTTLFSSALFMKLKIYGRCAKMDQSLLLALGAGIMRKKC